MNGICRCCLLESSEMESIFNSNNLLKLLTCAKITISENDGLPTLICKVCCQKMNDSYQFRIECENSQTVLKEWTQNCKNNPLQTDIIPQELPDLIQNETCVQEIVKQSAYDSSGENFSNQIKIKSNLNLNSPESDNEIKNREFEKPLEIEIYQEGISIPPIEETELINDSKGNVIPEDNQNTGSSDIICKLCKKKCTSSKSLSRHMSRHKEKKFKCTQCESSFHQPNQLASHIRAHTGEKPYECQICSKRFTSNSLLYAHNKTHLAKQKVCPICNKTLLDVRRHMKLHNEREKNFQCTECGKTFLQKASLTYHALTHGTEKEFKCTECPKSFFIKNQLDLHLNQHLGIRPALRLKCTICEKRFASKGELTIHTRTHTGERPFECSICKRRFLVNGNLIIHMRSHTGEKPYACPICKISFPALKSRKRHMQTHTGKNNFLCDVCGESFKDIKSRNNHRQIHIVNKKVVI